MVIRWFGGSISQAKKCYAFDVYVSMSRCPDVRASRAAVFLAVPYRAAFLICINYDAISTLHFFPWHPAVTSHHLLIIS